MTEFSEKLKSFCNYDRKCSAKTSPGGVSMTEFTTNQRTENQKKRVPNPICVWNASEPLAEINKKQIKYTIFNWFDLTRGWRMMYKVTNPLAYYVPNSRCIESEYDEPHYAYMTKSIPLSYRQGDQGPRITRVCIQCHTNHISTHQSMTKRNRDATIENKWETTFDHRPVRRTCVYISDLLIASEYGIILPNYWNEVAPH